MPYFKFEKGKYGESVPIEESRCWSCARLRHRTDGNFCCQKNRLLPKMLPEDFAAKCTAYMEDIKRHRNEYSSLPPRKSIRDSDTAYVDNERRTVSRDEQIRVLLAKGLARSYRGHVGTPQEVEKWKQEGFELTMKAISKKERVEELRTRFERSTKTPYLIRDQMRSVSRISKSKNIREAEYTWPLEDRDIFSISEIRVKGYCEECSNYGLLHYTDGLYLCENCRHSKINLF